MTEVQPPPSGRAPEPSKPHTFHRKGKPLTASQQLKRDQKEASAALGRDVREEQKKEAAQKREAERAKVRTEKGRDFNKRERFGHFVQNAAREAVEPLALARRQRKIYLALREKGLSTADIGFARKASKLWQDWRNAEVTGTTKATNEAHERLTRLAKRENTGETTAEVKARIEQLVSTRTGRFTGEVTQEVIKTFLQDPSFKDLPSQDQQTKIQEALTTIGNREHNQGNTEVQGLVGTDGLPQTAEAVRMMIDALRVSSGDHAAGIQALDSYIAAHADPKTSLYSRQFTQALWRGASLAKYPIVVVGTAIAAPVIPAAIAAAVLSYGASVAIGWASNYYRMRYQQFSYNIDSARGLVDTRNEAQKRFSKSLLSLAFTGMQKLGAKGEFVSNMAQGFDLERLNALEAQGKRIQATLLASRVALGRGVQNTAAAVGFGFALRGAIEGLGDAASSVGQAIEHAVPTAHAEGAAQVASATTVDTSKISSLQDLARGGCFIAGTLITMEDGSQKPIEKVVVGDLVMSFDEHTKQTVSKKVLEVISPLNTRMVTITFANGITTTNTVTHPYFVVGKGWSSYDPAATKEAYSWPVDKLEVEDIAYAYNDGQLAEVAVKELSYFEAKTQTYNLATIEDTHTFFANGMLVHNKSTIDMTGSTAHTTDTAANALNSASSGSGPESFYKWVLDHATQGVHTIVHDNGTPYPDGKELQFTASMDHGHLVLHIPPGLPETGDGRGAIMFNVLDKNGHMEHIIGYTDTHGNLDLSPNGPNAQLANLVDQNTLHNEFGTGSGWITTDDGVHSNVFAFRGNIQAGSYVESTHTFHDYATIHASGNPDHNVVAPADAAPTKVGIPGETTQLHEGPNLVMPKDMQVIDMKDGSGDHYFLIQNGHEVGYIQKSGDQWILHDMSNPGQGVYLKAEPDGAIHIDDNIMDYSGPLGSGSGAASASGTWTPPWSGVKLPDLSGVGHDLQQQGERIINPNEWVQEGNMLRSELQHNWVEALSPANPNLVKAGIEGGLLTAAAIALSVKKNKGPKMQATASVTRIAAAAALGSAAGLPGTFILGGGMAAIEVGRKIPWKRMGSSVAAAVGSWKRGRSGSSSSSSATPGAKRPWMPWKRSSKITGSPEPMSKKEAKSMFGEFTRDTEFNKALEAEHIYTNVAEAIGLGTTFASEKAAREAMQAELQANGLTKQEALDVQNGINTLYGELHIRGGQIYRTPTGGSETLIDADDLAKEVQRIITDPRRKALIRKHTADAAMMRTIRQDVLSEPSKSIGEVQKEVRDRLQDADPQDIKAVFDASVPAAARPAALYGLLVFGKLQQQKGLRPEHIYEALFSTTVPTNRARMYADIGDRLLRIDGIKYADAKGKADALAGKTVDPRRVKKEASDFIESLEEPKIRAVFENVATLPDAQKVPLRRVLGLGATEDDPQKFADAVISAGLNLDDTQELYRSPTPQNLERFKMSGLLRDMQVLDDELRALAEKITTIPYAPSIPRKTLIGEIAGYLSKQGVDSAILKRGIDASPANAALDVDKVTKELSVPSIIAELTKVHGTGLAGFAELNGIQVDADPAKTIQNLAQGLVDIGMDAPALQLILSGLPASPSAADIQAALQPVLVEKVMGQFDGASYNYIRSQIAVRVFGVRPGGGPPPPFIFVGQPNFVARAKALGINPFEAQRVINDIKGSARGINQPTRFVERFNPLAVQGIISRLPHGEAVAKALNLPAGDEAEAIDSLSKTFGDIEAHRIEGALHGKTTKDQIVAELEKFYHEAVIKALLPAGISAEDLVRQLGLPESTIDISGHPDPDGRQAENMQTLATYLSARKIKSADLATALQKPATSATEVVSNLKQPLIEALVANSEFYKNATPAEKLIMQAKLSAGGVSANDFAKEIMAARPQKSVDDVYKALYAALGGAVAHTTTEAYDRIFDVGIASTLTVPPYVAPVGPTTAQAFYTGLNVALPKILQAPPPPTPPTPTPPPSPDVLRQAAKDVIDAVKATATPSAEDVHKAEMASGFTEAQIKAAVREINDAAFVALTTPEAKVDALIHAMGLPMTRKAPLSNEQILVIAQFAGAPVHETRTEVRAQTDVTDILEAFDDVFGRGQPRNVFVNFVRSLDPSHLGPLTDADMISMYDYLADPTITPATKYGSVRTLVDHLITINP